MNLKWKSDNAIIFVATASLLSINTGALAQIPGVPSTQPTSDKKTVSTDGVLSGHVNTDILAAEKLLSLGRWSDAEGMFRDVLVCR